MHNIKLFLSLIVLPLLSGCVMVADDGYSYPDGTYGNYVYSEPYYVSNSVSHTYIVNNHSKPHKKHYVNHKKNPPHHDYRQPQHKNPPSISGKGGHNDHGNRNISANKKNPAMTPKNPVKKIKPVEIKTSDKNKNQKPKKDNSSLKKPADKVFSTSTPNGGSKSHHRK